MEIGYFQLDNLVKNKIPFTLLNFDVNTDEIYSGQFSNHLSACLLKIEHPYWNKNFISKLIFPFSGKKSSIIKKFKNKNFPSNQAFVLLCPDGEISKSIHHEIEKLGYLNAYWVRGGWNQIVKDYKQEQH